MDSLSKTKAMALLIIAMVAFAPVSPVKAAEQDSAASGGEASEPGESGTTHEGIFFQAPDQKTDNVKDATIRAGDRLDIRVYREEELSGVFTNNSIGFTVDTAGNFDYPLLGKIHAEGMTIGRLQQFLTDGLLEYLVDPQVQVSFHDQAIGNAVIILGQISKPGTYTYTPDLSLVKLISQAGGIATYNDQLKGFMKIADETHVRVSRKKSGQEEVMVVDVRAILAGAEPDFKLEAGDTVVIPDRDASSSVTILGQVMRPGNYVCTPKLTIVRLISDAGGFSHLITGAANIDKFVIGDERSVRVSRKLPDGKTNSFTVDVLSIMEGESSDVELEPGDIIFVPEKREKKIAIFGQVNQPGNYSFDRNMTLVKTISEAQGFTRYANAKRVKITRMTDSGTKFFEVNVDDVVRGAVKDPPLERGDIVFVPESDF